MNPIKLENEIIFVKLLPQVTLMYFLVSRRIFWDFITLLDLSYDYGENETKVIFFWDFMILLDSSNDSGENEVLYVKTGARVLDL